MRKVLIGLAILLAIIVIAAAVFVGKLDGLIEHIIETEGTASLGSQVSVAGVVTNLKEGSAVINGLTIANPKGYTKTNAIEVGEFSARVDYENRVIEDITIEAPTINAEILGTFADVVKSPSVDNINSVGDIKSNFKDLLDNMPESEEEDDGEETEITINRFAIQNAKISLIADQLGERSFTMKDLIVTNLSGTSDQISEQITVQVTQHIAAQIQSYATKEFKSLLTRKLKEEGAKQVREALKDKLNESALKGQLKNLKLTFGN